MRRAVAAGAQLYRRAMRCSSCARSAAIRGAKMSAAQGPFAAGQLEALLETAPELIDEGEADPAPAVHLDARSDQARTARR